MSIEREYGFIVICCDDCGETFMTNKGDPFETVWAEAKDDGWTFSHNRHWCHQPCEPSA